VVMGKGMILLAICLLSGCSALTGPDVERSLRDCLLHGGSASYVTQGDYKKFECKRG
jgi:hypothetical protein